MTTKEQTEQQRLRRQQDPTYREHYNRLRLEYYHRQMQDPEFAAKRRAKAKARRERSKEPKPKPKPPR